MSKKVSIALAPRQRKQAAKPSADDWVSSTAEMKRFVIDIPADLHRRIKVQCASRSNKMTDEVRRLLEEHYPLKG